MEEKIIRARLEADSAAGMSEPKVLKKEVYEASLDARRIVEDAHKEAESVLEQAARQRTATLETARQEGYRDGLAQWDEALRSLQSARETLHSKCEMELLRLAVRVAEKIIGEELRLRPETIVSIVRECLRGIRHEQTLIIHVNLKELDQVQQNFKTLQDAIGSSRHIQVVGDPAVSTGGCIVESDTGVIDARVETQLKCLEDMLLRTAVRR